MNDRDRLALLISEGTVQRRTGSWTKRNRAFTEDIEKRVRARHPARTINLAIRPKRRRK